MKRMNFPARKGKRREEAIARNAKTLPENRRQARLANADANAPVDTVAWKQAVDHFKR